MKGYSVVLEMRDKLCIVVGGGRVAERKVVALLASCADVRVVSPACTELLEHKAAAGEIEIVRRKFLPEDVVGAALVIAATNDPQTNVQIHHSISQHQWSNIVDRPDLCTFTVPAVVERGDIQIAISTGGKYPGYAKKLKQRLESVIGQEHADHISFLGAIREEILCQLPPSSQRKKLLARMMDDSFLAMTCSGNIEQRDLLARQLIQAHSRKSVVK